MYDYYEMKMPSSIGINLRVTGHCSQGRRKYMEDFFSVAYQQSDDEKDLEYAFFGIYDGHGGSEAAMFAKEHLMNAIVSEKLFWSDSEEDILRSIREGYIATHMAMWREQEKWPKTASGLPSTAGTTASVAFIRRGKIYIGHVGDSGIMLGYQEDGEKHWRAKPLTHDHKPECNVEKARITNSGGKVITKSGVPRVVWNRPRKGHKGPVRRSTPIDEIPFLAVARSLGDLWSYNSALNEFVVSPDPDVRVVKIDPKTFRCLIFGTDGLWNVLSPKESVDVVYEAEMINEKIAVNGESTDWTNPSKCLVDRALDRWADKKMRADNTSVVTIMLDPPGPPKKDLLRNFQTSPYGLEYNNMDTDHCHDNRMENPSSLRNDDSGLVLYDHSIRESTDLSTVQTNGYAIMTRYNNNCDHNILYYDSHNETPSCQNPAPAVNSIAQAASPASQELSQYMNSFAESYNSLVISILERENASSSNLDKEYLNSLNSNDMLETDHLQQQQQHSHHQPYHQQQQHQYQQQCMSADEGYSLTKLETRCEQQFNSMRNYQQEPTVSFQDYCEEDSFNQYQNITSSYQQPINYESSSSSCVPHFAEPIRKCNNFNYLAENNHVSHRDYEVHRTFFSSNPDMSEEQHINKNSYESLTSITMDKDEFFPDESIQINEISSSVLEPHILFTSSSSSGSSKVGEKASDEVISNSCTNILESHPEDLQSNNIKSKETPFAHHISKKKKNLINSRLRSIEQNENMSMLVEPRRLRSSALFPIDYTKRTLRSRNTLAKDLKVKTSNKNRRQQFTRRSAVQQAQFLKSPTGTGIRSRQIQQQVTVWSSSARQKKTKSSKTPYIPKNTSSTSTLPPLSTSTPSTSSVQCLVISKKGSSKANRNLKESILCNNKPKTQQTSKNIISNNSSTDDGSENGTPSISTTLICGGRSPVMSTSMSKRCSTSRNSSAWCPGKSAVQTRNRVQKRLNH